MTPIGIELGPRFLRTAVFADDHGPRSVSPIYAGRFELLSRVAVRAGVAMVLPANASGVSSFGLDGTSSEALRDSAVYDESSRGAFACVCLLRRAIRDARCEGAEPKLRIAVGQPSGSPTVSALIDDTAELLALSPPMHVDPSVAALAAIERPASGIWAVVMSQLDGTSVGLVHVESHVLRLITSQTVAEAAAPTIRGLVHRSLPSGDCASPSLLDSLCEEVSASSRTDAEVFRRLSLHARQVADVRIALADVREALRTPTRALARTLSEFADRSRALGAPLVGIRESGDLTNPDMLASAVSAAGLDRSLINRATPSGRQSQAFGLAVLAAGRLRYEPMALASTRSTREVLVLSRGRDGRTAETVAIPIGTALPATVQIVKYARPGQKTLDVVLKRVGSGLEPEFLHRQLDLTAPHGPSTELAVKLALDEQERLTVKAFRAGSGLPIPHARPLRTVDRVAVDPVTVPIAD
jgi:hypothetical protein